VRYNEHIGIAEKAFAMLTNTSFAPVQTMIESTNPATGDPLGRVTVTTPEAITTAMHNARLAQPAWERRGLRQRLALMHNLQNAMYRNLDRIIDCVVAEQGKPRFEAFSEFWPSIELIAYYRRNAPHILASRREFINLSPHRRHSIEYRAHGVVLVIAPWNFPLVLSMSPIVAALIGGNTVLYKPSEYATQTGEVITRVIHEAGIPRDVFQVIQGYGDVGAALVSAHPDKICFTGSVATGRKVAATAGELLIPLTLELGGKDAAIVLEDADLDRAARGLAWAGMFNAGQACLSVERIYAMRSIAEPLVEKMAQVVRESMHLGAGADPQTTVGAITNEAQIKIIESQVQEAVAQGARVVTGGQRLQNGHNGHSRRGRFYTPTILTQVTPEMRVVKDETFGPVIVVVPVDSAEEALRQANDTRYGLTGSVWTRDRARGLALARQMRVGNAGVNDHIVSASMPHLPWGGVGDSGYGRTRGMEGLREMMTTQALSVDRLTLPNELFWYPYSARKMTLMRRIMQLLYGETLIDRLRAVLP